MPQGALRDFGRLPGLSVRGGDILSFAGSGAYFAANFVDGNAVRLNGTQTDLDSTSGYSFTRASAAYYTDASGQLVQFASGQPRIGNRGLLVEGAATNLCLQSQTFNTSWTRGALSAFGSGSIVDDIAAPDGTVTADTINADGTSAQHVISQTVTPSAGPHTFSVYAKAGTQRYIQLRFSAALAGQATNFDLVAGVKADVSGGAPTASAITALGNGWYRCSITSTLAAATGAFLIFVVTGTGAAQNETNSLSGTVSLWGAQLEATAYATSYIPTTTGSLARAADVLSIGSLSVPAPYTMFAEVEFPEVGRQRDILGFGDTTNGAGIYIGGGNVGQQWVREASVTTANQGGGGAIVAAGEAYKTATRFAVNDTTSWNRGASSTTADTSNTPPTGTTLKIGTANFAGAYANAYLRRLAIYPTAYSNAQLQALTT